MRVQIKKKQENAPLSKAIRYDPKIHELAHNGVFMRKNRLSTVLTVDFYGTILSIAGKNPNNLKVNSNIYV